MTRSRRSTCLGHWKDGIRSRSSPPHCTNLRRAASPNTAISPLFSAPDRPNFDLDLTDVSSRQAAEKSGVDRKERRSKQSLVLPSIDKAGRPVMETTIGRDAAHDMINVVPTGA